MGNDCAVWGILIQTCKFTFFCVKFCHVTNHILLNVNSFLMRNSRFVLMRRKEIANQTTIQSNYVYNQNELICTRRNYIHPTEFRFWFIIFSLFLFGVLLGNKYKLKIQTKMSKYKLTYKLKCKNISELGF